MRSPGIWAVAVVLILCGPVAMATSFVVPTDEEMIAKSNAIVVATVEGSYVQDTDVTTETVYEVRVSRIFKGGVRQDELLRVVSPGGVIGNRGVLVPGAAHFQQGERVLLFLTRQKGAWTTTDLTLGKFRFTTSTTGARMLVRDMEDVVGWDHAGRVHREKVRREEGFLGFLTERLRGVEAKHDYEVEASEVTVAPEPEPRFSVTANAAAFPARTYTDFVNNQPIRWPSMSNGVAFYKRADQNIAGAADGGVSVIQNALAAWTNECGSLIVLNYGGAIAKASANYDGTNVVEFNDPQGRVTGSWTGSGTVAITFLSFTGTHQFLGEEWLNISDADIVFQDNYTAANGAFATSMTHEVGHGIGWRHSNQDFATGGACNSAVEECSSTAIMYSVASASLGFTLQSWDINAAQSVYPGGTCGSTPPPTCTAPAVTTQPTSRTINSGTSTTLTVAASGTGTLSYQWYVGTSGNTASPISGATSPSLTVAPTSTTSYWVRITNACGSVNSATATVTVNTPAPAGRRTSDFNGDGKSDLVLQNTQTAGITVWIMNGTAPSNGAQIAAPAGWNPVGAGDFDGDGRSDIVIRNPTTGEVAVYLLAANGLSVRAFSPLTNPGNAYQVMTTADFNRDGTDDIILQNLQTGVVSLWYIRNGTISGGVGLTQVATSWRVISSGDFDGDGWPDMLLQNLSNGQVTIWRMQNSAILGGQVVGSPSIDWRVMAAADVNGDGRSDVILQNQTSGHVTVWRMNGYSILDGHVVGTPGTSNVVKGRGDFNGDGVYDIVLQNTSTKTVTVWLMSNGDVASAGSHTPANVYELMQHR